MKGINKGLGLALALALVLTLVLAGCSKNEAKNTASSEPPASASASETQQASSEPPATPAIDTSKEVKLKGYLLGDAPKGMPDVLAELNKRLKQDINATLDIEHIGWGDLAAKYPLVLATGSDTEWIYTANWNSYADHASKGAFMELTEDMIAKYMPRYYASIDKVAFEQAKVNGKIYMLPAPALSPNVKLAVIRGDLREKYGLPEIKRISDLGPYLEAIKKNEPAMTPIVVTGTAGENVMSYQMVAEQGQYQLEPSKLPGATYSLEDAAGKLLGYDEEPLKTKLLNAAQTLKSWYDAGYINHDLFSNKVTSIDAFDQGKSAVGFSNTIAVRPYLDKGKDKGYNIEVIPFVDAEGKTPATSYLGNGVSIPAGAKNPERTMMAMDLIMSEQSYNYLAYFGIEGKNYVINADGKLALPEGVTAETNTYPPDAAGIWFTDLRQFPAFASWSDDYVKLMDEAQQMLYMSPLVGLNINLDDLKAETAALSNVRTQYLFPLQFGAVKDIDEAYNTFLEKAKAAGWQKVKDEAAKQINEFVQQQ